MKKTTCSSCASGNIAPFLDLGMSPIADAYTDTLLQTVDRYPLELAVCSACHLVQLTEVIPGEVLFNSEYSFYSSASAPLSAYQKTYADDVVTMFKEEALDGVLEIGCNDGDLLRHIAAAGFETLGIDPATGPVNKARERDLVVHNRPFTADFARSLDRKFGIVIANHVLAHVSDVADMLQGISAVLDTDGVVFIEVQYLPDLLVNNAFDLVYHEHLNFFSLTALTDALDRVGLKAIRALLTDRQGGSMRVVATHKNSNKHITTESVNRVLVSEDWLQSFEAYFGFQGRIARIKERLQDIVYNEVMRGGKLGIYGVPAKVTTLLSYCELDCRSFAYAVDSTPAKQGHMIPGTGIPIIPEYDKRAKARTHLLAAWNYASPIMRNHMDYMRFGGRWILPIPMPVII